MPYFVRRFCLPIIKAAIRSAIQMYEECQLIDPAPIYREKGNLEVNRNWQRLGLDIKHYGADADCGQSCISI